MPSNYPDVLDVFTEPGLPEETPLSQAGTGSRNHPEHHRDLGDAMEKVQIHAAVKTHDHSGDAGDRTKGSKLKQVNTHEEADTDSAPSALHHTLGSGANQAAPGNHNHDYNALQNIPFAICTSTTRPVSPTVGMLIYETDSGAFRQFAQYLDNQTVPGLNSLDDLERTNANDLGSTLWEMTYILNDATVTDNMHGKWAIPNGHDASWIDFTNDTCRVLCRRINPSDMFTETDDQVIRWKTGSTVIENNLGLAQASNDAYFRLSADRSQYVRVAVQFGRIDVRYTTTGFANEKSLGVLTNVDTNDPSVEWWGRINDRTVYIYRNGELIGSVVDRQQVSAKGPANRGWGAGAGAGSRVLGQTTPSSVQWYRIQDDTVYQSVMRWTILPIAKVPLVRLRQSSNQQLLQAGSIIEWSEELEDPFGYFSLSQKTDIVIKEPGLYDVETAIQWGPSNVPDQAHAVLCINGVETTYRNSAFMRGNTFKPGFSQSLPLAGSVRFNANDVLTVKVRYVAPGGLLGLIFSFFDGPSKINSRIDVKYRQP